MSRRPFHRRSRLFSVTRSRRSTTPSRVRLVNWDFLEPRTLLSTWYVNSANNSGNTNGQTPATGYLTIQAAISDANTQPGDTIKVENGNGYSEQDTITKSLTIEVDTGQDPQDTGSGTYTAGTAFTVNSSITGVTISGLTIANFATGIEVNSGSSATILGNSISDTSYAIYAEESSSATILDNSLSDDQLAILTEPSGSATILGNSISHGAIDAYGAVTIGGTSTGAGNTISGGGQSIQLGGARPRSSATPSPAQASM